MTKHIKVPDMLACLFGDKSCVSEFWMEHWCPVDTELLSKEVGDWPFSHVLLLAASLVEALVVTVPLPTTTLFSDTLLSAKCLEDSGFSLRQGMQCK